MDSSWFDDIVRSVISSRRSVLGGSLAVLSGWAGVSGADAKKKLKHKHKKRRKPTATPNEFGCLEVGDPCTSEEDCCSGICEGAKGKRTCRAHDTGSCRQDGTIYVPCNNRSDCGCFHTTAGSEVCSELFGPSDCAGCQKDADCEALGFPPGSACGLSAIPCEGGTMACYVPCGKAPVEA